MENFSYEMSASKTGTETDNTGVLISDASLELIKSSNTDYAVVGETIIFYILAVNNGNVPLSSINIYDQLSSSLEFIDCSVTIDGVPQPLEKINAGINVGGLDIGQSTVITFAATILSNIINPIPNTSNGSFNFQIPGSPPQQGNSYSNTIFINIDLVNIDVDKTANKSFVVLGDTVNYTVTITNSGTLDALNVIFRDILPSGTALIDGSFSVNGVVINAVDLAEGINVGNIAVGASDIVKYSVKVLASNCSMELVNCVALKLNYILPNNAAGTALTKPSMASSSTVELGISTFKQLSIEEYLMIPSQKPDAETINNVDSKIDAIKYHVAKTNTGQSREGQSVTGYKLIVHGVLKETIQYTACNTNQTVHSAHYEIPFSTFVVLPDNYVLESKIDVAIVVEDIYYSLLDCRLFFTNATVLVNIKILSC